MGEFAQRRRQALGAEGGWGGDAQGASGHVAVGLFGQLFGVGHQPQHLQTALVILAAELRKALLARGALEQADSQALFQGSQVVADHRGRHAAGVGCRCHAAGLHHFYVHRHCLEQIHYQALI